MVWKVKLLEKLKGFNYLKQERGSILVLVVLLLPIMFGCLGFAYDFGNLYMHRARLQNVADAAALAGARAYLDSQATDSKDNIDGTVVKTSESASGQLAPDSRSTDRTGRPAEYAYIASVANVKNPPSITHGDSQHPAADKAADDYIFKNIINLGNEVKSDKWSHYALNSNGDNPKTFYRVGLSEEVRLYFLPIIKNVPKTQTVRVGAIALVVPGEKTQNAGSGGSTTIASPSIFDNLFTFSEWLFTENQTIKNAGNEDNNTTVHSSFIGDMVYTHLNNMADAASSQYSSGSIQPNSFFTMAADEGGTDTYRYNHLYEDTIGTNIASGTGGTINDPYINTFYDTKAYLDAFKSKLNGPHVDVSEANASYYFNVSGDGNVNVKCLPKRYKLNGTGNYRVENNIYYLLDNSGNDVTFEENGKTYTVCYCPFLWSGKYMRCGKNADDSKYYILNENGNISNCYIVNGNTPMISLPEGEKYLGLTWDNKLKWGDQYYQPDNQILTLDQLKPKVNLAASVSGEAFEEIPVTFEATTSNVYHLLYRRLDDPNQIHNHVHIVIDDPIVGEDINEPLYVLVEGIYRISIEGSADMRTGRPLIIVFLSEGTGQIEYNFNGHFKGTIYAPISTFEQVKGSGSFTGNLIAKTIYIQDSDTTINFIQENHLEKIKYNYIADSEKGDFVNENGVWVRVAPGKGTHRREAVYKFTGATDGNGDYKQDADGEYVDANGVRWRKVDKGTGTHTGEFDYLYKDDKVKAVSDTTKQKIEDANKNANLTEDKKKEIYTKLGLSEAEMAAMASNPNWYNEQTFRRKKQLYTSWKTLYNDPDYASIRDLLWPWNEHFDIETSESEPTDEILRLINFRTDFQEKNPDGSENKGEKDPFIYLSLDGKSY